MGDEQDRTERQMAELLQELRVALPGVQILFAFLLTVPFAQRFGEVTSFQKNLFFATLMCTTRRTPARFAAANSVAVFSTARSNVVPPRSKRTQ